MDFRLMPHNNVAISNKNLYGQRLHKGYTVVYKKYNEQKRPSLKKQNIINQLYLKAAPQTLPQTAPLISLPAQNPCL